MSRKLPAGPHLVPSNATGARWLPREQAEPEADRLGDQGSRCVFVACKGVWGVLSAGDRRVRASIVVAQVGAQKGREDGMRPTPRTATSLETAWNPRRPVFSRPALAGRREPTVVATTALAQTLGEAEFAVNCALAGVFNSPEYAGIRRAS